MNKCDLSLVSLTAAVMLAAGLAGCADENNDLGGGTTSGGTTGTTSGGTTGGDPGACVINCSPNPPPPPTSLEDCNPNNPNATFAPVANVTSVDVGTSGLCINCRVSSPLSAFDANVGTFAVETAGLGVTGSIDLTGYGTTSYESSPTVLRRAGFFVAYPQDSVADVALLSRASAFSVNGTGAIVQGPGVQTSDTALSLQLLGLPLLAGQSLAFVSVVTTQPFNGARLEFSPTIGVLAGLNVIEACISK